jgi:hypothetical protein
VTLFATPFALYLILPAQQRALTEATDLSGLFLACGALIGTVLALVFSLAIIPVQRAAESFGARLTWVYRDDRAGQFIFVALACFCALSFAAATGVVPIVRGAAFVPVQLLVVAITLDLLRWHHRHVLELLEPGRAVALLLKHIQRYLSQTDSGVRQFAARLKQAQPPEDGRESSQQAFEAVVYSSSAFTAHASSLNHWTETLGELASRAVGKGETHTARIAISALAELAQEYMRLRKNNLTLQPKAPFVLGSSIDGVLTPIYEELRTINTKAVTVRAEATCSDVVRALGSIAAATAGLNARAFQEHTAPITWFPLGYMKGCSESAQRHGLHDAVLDGCRASLHVVQRTPGEIAAADVYLPAIKGITPIAGSYFAASEGLYGNEVTKCMLHMARDAAEKRHLQLADIVREVLDQMYSLMPLGLVCERSHTGGVLGPPLSPAYDLTQETALGHIVARRAEDVTANDSDTGRDRYSEFHALNEPIHEHLWRVADDLDLGSSALVWHITNTIKAICRCYYTLLKEAPSQEADYSEKLVGQIPSYLSFFWTAFKRAKAIDQNYAEHACDELAQIGLYFASLGHTKIADVSADNIVSVAQSYHRSCRGSDSYGIADLLAPVHCLQVYARARNDEALLDAIAAKLNTLPASMVQNWPAVHQALSRRHKSIEERLHDPDGLSHLISGDAVAVLWRLLRQEPRGESGE